MRGQCPVLLNNREFVDCTAESRIQTSVLGRRGSKALLLALHDKEEFFFQKKRTFIYTVQNVGILYLHNTYCTGYSCLGSRIKGPGFLYAEIKICLCRHNIKLYPSSPLVWAYMIHKTLEACCIKMPELKKSHLFLTKCLVNLFGSRHFFYTNLF